ncbi:PAS domain-containing serine/threonine-protein kinase-like isoform X2 [Ornithodoros turicata]
MKQVHGPMTSSPALEELRKRQTPVRHSKLAARCANPSPSTPPGWNALRNCHSEQASKRRTRRHPIQAWGSFSPNLSFPPGGARRGGPPPNGPMGDPRKCSLNKLRGDTLWSLSYSLPGSVPGLQPAHGGSTNLLSGSWVFYGGLGQGTPTSLLNPQKAVLTVDAATTQILTGNKAACSLLKVMSTQLSSKQLCNFLVMKKGQYALTEPDVTASGEVVVIAGKVMDLVDNDGEVVPVSVWMRRLGPDSEPRCLVVMEPVQRTTATVVFDADKGKITAADKSLALLCGYSSGSDLEGMSITELIPALQLPTNDGVLKTVRKQQATGRTRDGGSFPLSILIEPLSDAPITPSEAPSAPCSETPRLYRGTVWVFANISGMITILPDGTVHSCNSNFSLMMFGYTQSQLQGKSITALIPSFYDDFEFLDTDSVPLPLLDDDEEDSRAYIAADDRAGSDSVELCRPLNPTGKGCRVQKVSHMSSTSLEEMERCLQGLALSTSVTSVKPHVGTSGSFQRSTSAADPLAPLLGPSGECSGEGRLSDVNGNVDQTCTEGRGSDRPRCSMKSSISADHIEIRLGEGDVFAPGAESAKRSPLRQRKRSAEASCSSGLQLKDLAEEEEDDDNGLIIPSEPAKLSTSESFHSTSTVTSSTVHSTEENTQEAVTGEKGTDDTTAECALKPDLRTFRSTDSLLSISEGSYSGLGRHKDGTDIAILYQVRRVELEEGSSIYCLWVSRDMELYSGPHYPAPASPLRSLTLGSSATSYLESSHPTTDISDLENFKSPKPGDESVEPQESEYTSGVYSDHYTTLQQIGKGAYGCVKMAYRNTDHLLVITKFIRKSKVYEEGWVNDRLIGRVVPMEVSLLTTFSHPNIVHVLDVFENAGYFQMVMEKHGSGMDLFEFIDRSPQLDEPLASYIFRQVVSALTYLHSLRILHRDVKDENIILDERFKVKLIDFGSAAFMAPDKVFTTFCGTMEYCSPEVLQGDKYTGPELEMWALGVTLYTLIFGENPFFDVEETISGVLKPPCGVSTALWELISWLLHRDPKKRCTLPEAERHEWTTQPVCPESYRFEDVVHATPEEIHPSKHFHQDSSIYLSSSLYDLNRRGRSLSCGSSQAHLTASTDKQRNSSELAYDSEDISEELDSCS